MAFYSFSINRVFQLAHLKSSGSGFLSVVVISLIIVMFQEKKVDRLIFHMV